MNYLLKKTHILEIKLKLTSILLDKQEFFRKQHYEKVADLRLEEKELLGKLNEKKITLLNFKTIW